MVQVGYDLHHNGVLFSPYQWEAFPKVNPAARSSTRRPPLPLYLLVLYRGTMIFINSCDELTTNSWFLSKSRRPSHFTHVIC
uniref:Uncharacterized protein n=1 Tax=Arabidopsis thaliana TaxID=3702 RepID=Q94EG8_ARATH|nr:unknown protein [Arabidopsis thaliana]